MHATRTRRPEEVPEKRAFERAKRESEAAREYARRSIETARREMNWLEDALTPPASERKERREP